MICNGRSVRVFTHAAPTDLCKGFDGLVGPPCPTVLASIYFSDGILHHLLRAPAPGPDRGWGSHGRL